MHQTNCIMLDKQMLHYNIVHHCKTSPLVLLRGTSMRWNSVSIALFSFHVAGPIVLHGVTPQRNAPKCTGMKFTKFFNLGFVISTNATSNAMKSSIDDPANLFIIPTTDVAFCNLHTLRHFKRRMVCIGRSSKISKPFSCRFAYWGPRTCTERVS